MNKQNKIKKYFLNFNVHALIPVITHVRDITSVPVSDISSSLLVIHYAHPLLLPEVTTAQYTEICVVLSCKMLCMHITHIALLHCTVYSVLQMLHMLTLSLPIKELPQCSKCTDSCRGYCQRSLFYFILILALILRFAPHWESLLLSTISPFSLCEAFI